MRKFEGHDQGQYVLRSCFGGATENFVLSGSAGNSLVICIVHFRSSLTLSCSFRRQDCCVSSRYRATSLQAHGSRCHDCQRRRLEPRPITSNVGELLRRQDRQDLGDESFRWRGGRSGPEEESPQKAESPMILLALVPLVSVPSHFPPSPCSSSLFHL